MTELDLKKKMMEWLGIKRQADVLEKTLAKDERQDEKGVNQSYANKEQRDSHAPSVESSIAGISQAGMSLRSQDFNPKSNAKEEHKRIISELKSMPKPNLPKSELDKSNINSKRAEHRNLKGVHTSGGFSGLEEKGQSQAGRNIERAKEPQPNKYLNSLYHERGKESHRENLKDLKQMPKPNLPKSELDKASISMPMGGGMKMSGINIGPVGVGLKDDKKKKKTATTSSITVAGPAAPAAPGGTAPMAMSEDQGPKSPFEHMHEDIVAGVPTPKHLKQFDGPVPYDHPHRELAAAFVTDVWRKNRREGMRMSDKYLGIGNGLVAGEPPKATRETYANIPANPKMQKAVHAIPASYSDPQIINRENSEHPKEINSPLIVNAYKSEGTEASGNHMLISDIVNVLKRKKYGP